MEWYLFWKEFWDRCYRCLGWRNKITWDGCSLQVVNKLLLTCMSYWGILLPFNSEQCKFCWQYRDCRSPSLLLSDIHAIFSALAKFSEAILDYVANIEKAPDPAVRKEAYSGEIDAAYDVVFSVWLHSKETRVKRRKYYSWDLIFHSIFRSFIYLPQNFNL